MTTANAAAIFALPGKVSRQCPPSAICLRTITGMQLSTRNQLDGTVISVTRGEAMAVVRVRLTGGDEITSSITRDAVDDLELTEGSAVKVLIKATEVALGVE
ncbi:Molybdenum transport protein ModE [Nocardia gamkensis]|nr:Molybdenum transport protein ModE [Nocardia gamkensis]